MEKIKRIYSLDSLRIIAILLIFCSHLTFVKDGYNDFFMKYLNPGGPLGVQYFIVLSGFGIGLKYYDTIEKVSLKSSWKFMLGKIKKMYPLHILTFMIALPFSIKLIKEPLKLVFEIIANLSLTQTLIPSSSVYFSFNAVSWFLSEMVFFYFLTPWIIKQMNKLPYKVNGGGSFIY